MKPPSRTYQNPMFRPLQHLTVETTARQVLTQRFDFGPRSAVARHLIARALEGLQREDQRHGLRRVDPFTLRFDWRGVAVPVRLLDGDMARELVGGKPLSRVLRDRRELLFKELLGLDSQASFDEVRRHLAPGELLVPAGRRRGSELPPPVKTSESMRHDLVQLRHVLRLPEELLPSPSEVPTPPASVLAELGPVIEAEGMSPDVACSLLGHLQALRERFCLLLEDLAPGQLLAVATDVTDRRMSLPTSQRRHVPVRLTLYTETELAALERIGPHDRQEVQQVLMMRVARMLTEAYCQGGLLSLVLVAILTQLSPHRVGRLVDRFEATQGLILPTPGTIHDAGSKTTHKATVVRRHLAGDEVQTIARDTLHAEDAVARYIDDFERTLIAFGHGISGQLLGRVLKLGGHVVDQYEALIAEHIGGVPKVRELLANRGIRLGEAVT